MIEGKGGAPHTLTDELSDRILDVAEDAFTVTQVARLSKVNYKTLNNWLIQGEKDHDAGLDTVHSRFLDSFNQKVGKKIACLLDSLQTQNSYQSISWLLENCYPDEFGQNSYKYRQLLDMVNKLVESHQEKK